MSTNFLPFSDEMKKALREVAYAALEQECAQKEHTIQVLARTLRAILPQLDAMRELVQQVVPLIRVFPPHIREADVPEGCPGWGMQGEKPCCDGCPHWI